jgi:hypothetical protein
LKNFLRLLKPLSISLCFALCLNAWLELEDLTLLRRVLSS